MVLGAGWAGGRGMTATSDLNSINAGIHGLAYFAEIPSVFWDVCRVGHQQGYQPEHSNQTLHYFTKAVMEIPNTLSYSWNC